MSGNMMLSKQLAVLIFIAFFAIGSNAAPAMTGIDHVNQVKAILEVLSKSAAQASKAVALPLHNFLAKSVYPSQNRNLKNQEQDPCTKPPQCENPNAQAMACMMEAASLFSRMENFNPFAFPAMMCQLQTRNASCVPILLTMVKTCACMDFKPMYDLVCPTSPTASPCSKNVAVQEFFALNTNSSLGFFGLDAFSSFGRLMATPSFDFSTCGDRRLYRITTIINNIGACLTEVVNAFPLPTWFNTTGPQGTVFMRGSLTCGLTSTSYSLRAVCAGNAGRCYSAINAPSSNLGSCASFTAGTCSAECKTQLSAFGAASSNSPGKCCVNYFSQNTPDAKCSADKVLSMSDIMGPQCTSFIKDAVSSGNIPSQPGGPAPPTPQQIGMFLDMKVLSRPCPFDSPQSFFIKQCNVPTANLEGECPSSNTPYVQSSLFAPVKSTTVTLRFASSGLSAVFQSKYPETLTAVSNALSNQLPSTFTVLPISVVAQTGRRLLQAGQFTATLAVTSTLMSGNVNPATTVSGINAGSLTTSLDTELKSQVSPTLTATVPSGAISATAEQNAPPPADIPGGSPPAQPASPPAKVSSSSFNTPSFAMMVAALMCMTLFFP